MAQEMVKIAQACPELLVFLALTTIASYTTSD